MELSDRCDYKITHPGIVLGSFSGTQGRSMGSTVAHMFAFFAGASDAVWNCHGEMQIRGPPADAVCSDCRLLETRSR
jgi:hypothetical protein